MYRNHTVGVVVPAYDEENFVGEVVETIPEFVDRIYPVDDASTDETWDEIRAAARRVNAQREFSTEREAHADGESSAKAEVANAVPDGAGVLQPPDTSNESSAAGSADQHRVVPLRHDENRGVGAAIKTGYREAREDGMDAVAVMAGDAQMDPDQLPRLLDPVVSGRAAYAKGNRLAMDEYREEMSRWRQFGNDLLTLLTRISSGYWSMSDPQNGYTVIASEALDQLDLDAVFDDYGFANAMLVHLNVADLRVADVPMPARYGDEESGIRYSTFVPQLSALLAKGFVWRLAEKHVRRGPRLTVLLYALGVVGTLVGLLGAAWGRGHGQGRGRCSGGPRDEDNDGDESETDTAENGAEDDEEPETKLRYDDDDEFDSQGDERAHRSGQTERSGRPNRGGQTPGGDEGRTGRWGPMTAVAGLAATGLAITLDAGHSEDLHVTVDGDRERDDSADSSSGGEA